MSLMLPVNPTDAKQHGYYFGQHQERLNKEIPFDWLSDSCLGSSSGFLHCHCTGKSLFIYLC